MAMLKAKVIMAGVHTKANTALTPHKQLMIFLLPVRVRTRPMKIISLISTAASGTLS